MLPLGTLRSLARLRPIYYSYRSTYCNTQLRCLNLGRPISFVKSADAHTAKLAQTPTSVKIELLLAKVEPYPELINLLHKFFSHCRLVGVTHTGVRPEKRSARFFLTYIFMLRPIHIAFWDACQSLDILEHHHRIPCNPADLGLLDPKNFSPQVYSRILQNNAPRP